MLRHLPPTAAPPSRDALRAGLTRAGDTTALDDFRAALRNVLDVRECVLASSGRTALYLLLDGLRQRADQPARCEVVLPAYTCPALVTVIQAAGLRPRLVDLSPTTFAVAVDDLAAAIGEQTLAVIHVHPFGLPLPVEDALALAHAAGAVVIEDAAQAMGARLGQRPAGAVGDFGLFSLGPGKPLSTGGGGVVCATAEMHADLLRAAWSELPAPSSIASGIALLRLVAFTLAFHPMGWWLATHLRLDRVGELEASWGFSVSGLSASQAAAGNVMLGRLDAVNRRRRKNAERLRAHLRDYPGIHFPPPSMNTTPIYLRLPLLVDNEEWREQLYRRLRDAGIGVGKMYRRSLSAIFPEIADRPYRGADSIAGRLLTLPTHPYLADSEIERIVTLCAASVEMKMSFQ